MADSQITGREILGRLDMVELFVKNNQNNLVKYNAIRDFIYDLSFYFREPGRPYLQGRRIRQDICDEFEEIILKWPVEYSKNDLLRIRIVNRQKWDWESHHRYIRSVGALLEIHRIEYGISKLEVAFDTLDEEVAREFATSISIKWGRPNRLFNYETGTKRIGGSSNGMDEYMFFRGRSGRQTHAYIRKYSAYGFKEFKKIEEIHRWELKFTRKHLRRNGIETIDDLLRKVRSLVENSISFKKLNRRSLNRRIPRAKDWHLMGKSIPEQYRMLSGHGLSRAEIQKYFGPASPPEIIYAFDERGLENYPKHLEYALCSEHGRSMNRGAV